MLTKGRLIGAGVVLALLLVLAALFTPSVVLEPDHQAVAESLDRALSGEPAALSESSGRCRSVGDGFSCTTSIAAGDYTGLDTSAKSVTYAIRVNWLGCWDGEPVAGTKLAEPVEGCIFLWDY